MSSAIAKLNSINKLRGELEKLSLPRHPWKLGEIRFKKWDLFHRQSVLIIKSLFGKNSQCLHDWQEVVI